MTISAVLFDVDGTLVDSNYHHTMAWARAFRAVGHDIPLAAIHRRIGMGGAELVEALIGHPDDTVQKEWRDRFDELLPEVVAFSGAGDLLRDLHDRGLTIVLATSSPGDLLGAMRAKINADDAIDEVVTSDDAERAKPHPDIFTVALDKARVPRDQAMAVGDSVWDVHAASRAGLACTGLESGGYCRAELEEAGAIAVYGDPTELRARVAEWVS